MDLVDIYAVGTIVKLTSVFSGALCAAALLLPSAAVPESHVQAAAASGATSATARVNFKIVIPQVLYMRADGQTVAVMANSRNVTLTASAPTPAGSGSGATLILRAAARKAIAQNGVCGGNRVLCTVSMP